MECSGFIPTEIFSGVASGPDQLGESWARERGVPIRRFYADWSIFGKSAGPIRNREMAENADALIAIWDGESRGTANMIKEAIDHNLKVKVFLVSNNRGSFVIEEVTDFSPLPSIRRQAELHGMDVDSLKDNQITIDTITGKRQFEEDRESNIDEDYVGEEDVSGERIEDSTLTPRSV